ncbi:hypothetical protein [Cutibacterium sp.]|uniref:hypothetical protein n=1 Tax=Cutibacterium sp. TaxID=1912221 RepID=UPI0026DD48C7|nr:hypothetical protein [Cutibacterium sp.]MDO4413200.1 hypothetical protein [Cutibacterium sp.]
MRTWVALGRQAFSVVARWLRDGVCPGGAHSPWIPADTLVVPWFCCQTMVTPWQLEGYRVRRVEVGDDFLLDADSLAAATASCRQRGEHPVVLSCETFGIQPSLALAGALEVIRRDGIPVVVDRTHSFLGPSSQPADVEVVSTRKLAPLTEVAWVKAVDDLSGLVGVRGEGDELLTAARRRFLVEPGVDTFEVAEDLADECWTPVPPDDDARRAFEACDITAYARLVEKTRDDVVSGLPEAVHVVNPRASCAVVLQHPDAAEIADRLRDVGIVGPLHWDRPRHLDVEWPDDLVSLPPVMDGSTIDRVVEVVTVVVNR